MNKVVKTFQGKSKGVSAIEVIIALAILGVVAIAFLGGLFTALNATSIADERSVAQSLAGSQMEYVKNQDYNEAPTGGEATYAKIDLSAYPNYFIKGINRNGDAVDEIKGIPWDTENGQPSTDDDHIQKITVVVKHNDKELLTLEDYKLKR